MVSSSGKRDNFFSALAIVSFVADAYTIFQFVSQGVVFDFWTFRWIVSIVLVAFLAGGGFLFLELAGRDDIAEKLLVIFGVFYIVCSMVTYLFWGYQQVYTPSGLGFGDYFGYFVLFALTCVTGLACTGYDVQSVWLYPAYAYATSNLLFVFLLVHNYVMNGSSFIFWQFAGNVTIFIIGAVLFFGLYVAAQE